MSRRGPYAKSGDVRDQILEAALTIIAHNGYSGATLQLVADTVGLSKTSVLHHFGSREALLTAVLTRRDELSRTLPGSEDSDALAALLETVRANAKVPGLVALFSALTGVAAAERDESAARSFLMQRYPLIVSVLTRTIVERQARGEVRPDLHAESAARSLVAAADGLQIQWLIDPTIDMAAHLELLWLSLAGPSGDGLRTGGDVESSPDENEHSND